MTFPRFRLGGWGTILVVLILFAAVSFLPADTSLAELEKNGILRACVPTEYPPLVTRDPEAPGLDIELLQAVAERMGVTLSLNANSAIGRDFNPRNWRVTRAQCHVLAGGVVASEATRSFLDTTPPHLATGWAMVFSERPETLNGLRVGFYAGLTGLDRISLSRYLRSVGATASVVNTPDALAEGVRSGEFAAGISEALTARQIAGTEGFGTAWLPGEEGRYPIAFGLWKGDLTLKRRLIAILEDLEREGIQQRLAEKYSIAPITETLQTDSAGAEAGAGA